MDEQLRGLLQLSLLLSVPLPLVRGYYIHTGRDSSFSLRE